ncbi:AAEL003299-PA [Aedes aegypti]|uniref:AAEL003299-PA n=1 Tax=Aedes aegypti TaxID=7159 RepID=Q17FR4_AEDAE|nr:AAEL003299-PA [Aedes aegypti]
MKVTVLLFLAGASVAVGLPSTDRSRRQAQKPETTNVAQPQPNFGFGNFGQFGNAAGWPLGQGIAQRQGFDQMWPQSTFNSAKGGFGINLPKIEGADGVTATAGMSCSYENGKKKCTNHHNQAKTRF